MERGSLSINSENMFPIIKKWLYSDHDIFLRELVSNGCDAITKLKKLDMMGDFEIPEGYRARIDIVTDPEEKTIKVTDNGLGMTADERVCSGAHYAAFFFDVIRLLDNPEELETPPQEVRFEQGVEYHVPKISEQK